MENKYQFSEVVSVFRNRQLPEKEVLLAGYSALIKTYNLQVPLPDILSAISHKHKIYQKGDWQMFTPRHWPNDSLYRQLKFALKYEGVDLVVLSALFKIIEAKDISDIVKQEPTSTYSRRIWFLYEWLQNKKTELPDAASGKFVDVLDENLQYPGLSKISKRHRVRNNLPGTQYFCPTIRKTSKLEKLISMKLGEKARTCLGLIHPDLLMRAAAFMLLKDSKASFAIEGESPPQSRAERWGQVIGEAGKNELSEDEFLRLQSIIISDFRFIQFGYRNEGGFIGEHERATGMPIPEHISARPQDLHLLMDNLIETHQQLKESNIDPVLAAATIAFGFVFIHPFEDGNGRLHRYLIHHVLAEKNFSQNEIVFPISATILSHIFEYRKILEAFSHPRLAYIEWRPTIKNNVEVLNETINLYRYFDATKQAEFLYDCVKETIEITLPEEVSYLKKYDELKNFISNYLDMPNRLIDLLIRFLVQEKGILSKRARKKEFSLLTKNEVDMIEEKYKEIFNISK